jgi:hypothetical protein
MWLAVAVALVGGCMTRKDDPPAGPGPSAPISVQRLTVGPVTPSPPKSRSASGRAFVASPGGLRAIAGAAASGRGGDHGEGSAASFSILDFPVSWPVIAVGEAAKVLLIFGFPQWRV